MNGQEAKRYAHFLVADALARTNFNATVPARSPDWPRVASALEQIGEQHRRFGPKFADRKPRDPDAHATPLLDQLEPPDAAT